jgi:HEAT repeat protein
MFQSGIWILTALLMQTPSLDSASPKERLDAVDTMSLVGRTENVAPLAAALKKESKSEVRGAIVAGLGRIGGPEVVPILTQSLLTDLDKDVRLQVVDSLQRLYIPVETQGSIKTVFNKVKSVFLLPDRPLVHDPKIVSPAVNAALAEAMQRDFSQEVRAASARALGSLRAVDRVAILVQTLEAPQNKEHPEVRLEIVESLGLIRDFAAAPALQRALRDNDKMISQAAILSLGMVGDKASRPALESMFRTDKSSESRKRALQAVALMRDPGALPFFESLLGHEDDTYRELAAEGLARIDHDYKVVESRYETEKKDNVRNALAFALVSADQDKYFNDLANALDSRQANQAEAYLVELAKYEGKLPELHRYLQSDSPKIRAKMAHVIGNVGDPSSRPLIEALTKDKDSAVVTEAVIALRKLTPA